MTDTPRLPVGSGLHYAHGTLHLEQVSLAELVKRFGSPLYVYSKQIMLDALHAYTQGLSPHPHRVHYAMKANSSLAVLQVFANAGCGFDIVSGGELARAMQAGARAQDCVFSGVGKTTAEIDQALAAGIGCFNVESLSELQHISSRAQALGKVAPISLRVNPDVDAGTHPYISTGLRDNKFGIAHADAVAAYRHASELAGLQITGIDCHIGSQITQATPFFDAMERVFDLVDALTQQDIALQHIDLGGGLGIDYQGEQPPSATHLWQTTVQRLHARGLQRHALWCEPGRSLVGNAGVCLSQVVVCKPTAHKNFLILDAAMNDLPRPAMYQAYHEIVPVTPRNEAPLLWDVVGPVCETGDWLGRERVLAAHEGDVLAICSAGAYGMSMASQYNARPRAAEVLVHGDTVHLIRERERHETLWQGEHLVT